MGQQDRNPSPWGRVLRCVGVAAMLALVTAPARAMPGTVVNTKEEAVAGVTVCHNMNGTNMLCVSSDAQGRFDLPHSDDTKIRVTKEGYLPRLLDRLPDGEPIVIERAAEIWVRLVDSDGEPIADGEVYLLFPSGERKGPFPVNAQGVRVRTLAPGEYRVVARSDGFVQQRSFAAKLVGGMVAEALVELEPTPSDD